MKLFDFISKLKGGTAISVYIANLNFGPVWNGKVEKYFGTQFSSAYWDATIFQIYMQNDIVCISANSKDAF